jgi:hypothetical protein
MTGVRLLNGIDGKGANCIDAKSIALSLVDHGFILLMKDATLELHAGRCVGGHVLGIAFVLSFFLPLLIRLSERIAL